MGVQHGQGAKIGVLIQPGTILQQAGLAFDQQHGSGEDDHKQHSAGESVAVIGERAHRGACAKRHRSRLFRPLLTQVNHADRSAQVPAMSRIEAVPFVACSLVRLHAEREESCHAVQPQPGRPERNTGGPLRRQVEREVGLPLLHSEYRLAVNLHIEGDEIQGQAAVKLLRGRVIRDGTLEIQYIRYREGDPDPVQADLRRASVLVPREAQPIDRGSGRHPIHQGDSSRKADPLAPVACIAEAKFLDHHREAIEVQVILARQVEPAALEMNVAFGVNREFLDLEGGPVQRWCVRCAEERRNLAAEFGDEGPLFNDKADALQLYAEDAGFGEGVKAISPWTDEHDGEFTIQGNPDVYLDRFVKERQNHCPSDTGAGESVLDECKVQMLQAERHVEQGARKCGGPVGSDRACKTACTNVAFLKREVAGYSRPEAFGQVNGSFLDEDTTPPIAKGRTSGRQSHIARKSQQDVVRLDDHARITNHGGWQGKRQRLCAGQNQLDFQLIGDMQTEGNADLHKVVRIWIQRVVPLRVRHYGLQPGTREPKPKLVEQQIGLELAVLAHNLQFNRATSNYHRQAINQGQIEHQLVDHLKLHEDHAAGSIAKHVTVQVCDLVGDRTNDVKCPLRKILSMEDFRERHVELWGGGGRHVSVLQKRAAPFVPVLNCPSIAL
ncbi:MAG TPA: hypothetical protein VF043_16765 [Ktedonobacteraceae bacterium]